METLKLNGDGELRIARTEMDVPHKSGIITFGLPLVGPGAYQDVMGGITKDNLLRPTTAQKLSLVYLALQNSDEENCKTIISRFKDDYLWTCTKNDHNKDSNEIVVYDDINGDMPSDRETLIKRFKDGDEAIRVVPYGFKTGEQSISEMVKNSYLIAQIGDKDFAEDIVVKISKLLKRDRGYVFALEKPTNAKMYTAVNSDWNDDWLYIYGDCGDSDNGGCASGIALPLRQN